MKKYQMFLLLILSIAVLTAAVTASAALPPVSGAQLIIKPLRTEQGSDVRRAYYQVGGTEIKATLAQMGTQLHFTLWEGKQNVFHFSAPASRLGLGSSGAFMSDGHLFFYCNINTRAGWRPPGAPPASGRAVIVGKPPVDGAWRIYVDSSDYYNPIPDDFQVYIGSVQHSADHPYIALAFGRELYTDTGRPAVRYRLAYHADTDQFTYEEE
mgnify:FL=1